VSERLLLAGAAVQRVDVGPAIALVRARLPGETWHVVLAARRGGEMGITRERPWKGAGLPGGMVAEGEKRRFRARLEGGRVEAVGPRWVCVRAGEARFVIAPKPGDSGGFSLRELGEGEPLPGEAARAEDEAALAARGEEMARALGEQAIEARAQDLKRALARARARVARRAEAVRGDLGRIGEADAIAAKATLFVAAAARAPRGATRLATTDWSSGEPVEVAITLDPARSAREQIEAMFKRARRLQAGATIARERLADAEKAAAGLAAIEARLGEAATAEAIEALAQEARAAAPRDFALATAGTGAARGAAGAGAPSLPYRVFRGASGVRILVGRGAAHNDALTFRTARPHDLWLHAKGWRGAHVIVPLDKNHMCPADLLVDAAHLAAHFSDARAEAVVEIQHTARRHLRKPRGSAPGLVVVDREKVLVLQVEPDRVARLLAAEDLAADPSRARPG
jgi:hypothetical protein